ncbi:MAG: Pyridoxal 5'-phosphate synthase subunit PdxT [Chlamydiae bacterium]|nr:Pyridoxal 5'-phosphate synthase subunit PdxT [Chlamydiota bacterium]
MKCVIGVLALQGGFTKHIEMLQRLGVATFEVRQPQDLERCDALVIPGGESTTIQKQITFTDFEEPLKEFMAAKPVFGTCAGLILMAQNCLDITVKRNGYGRQIESCRCSLDIKFPSRRKRKYPGIFIRAPRIQSVGEDVNVLGEMNGEPVLVQQGCFLGATFHPELTDDSGIHEYFCKIVLKNLTAKKQRHKDAKKEFA